MYNRILSLSLSEKHTCFLWGPRQTGKSTLLKRMFPDAQYYDLLLSDVYARLLRNPSLLREECLAKGLDRQTQKYPVIIDEVQKLPPLLDEVHWLIENKGLRFILCGSSARKLKRGQGNLLGGRAVRYELFPLVYKEIPDFSLEKALNDGLLPSMYTSEIPERMKQSYIGDYLKEEIMAEALTRNIPAFSRFLEVSSFSNGEILNYQNIAAECGISAPTVKDYFQILYDTLIGRTLPAYRKRSKRRLIQSPKFYYFDVGIVAYLSKRGRVEPGSELFGRAFEHFIFSEIITHSHYSELFYPIAYWRTSSGFEVDFVLGDCEIAIEAKSSSMVHNHHLKGIRAFKEEYTAKRYLVVSMDTARRKTEDGIEILPWKDFLDELWDNNLVK